MPTLQRITSLRILGNSLKIYFIIYFISFFIFIFIFIFIFYYSTFFHLDKEGQKKRYNNNN